MRALYFVYDIVLWVFFKKKAINNGYIKLYREAEIANIQIGMTVTSVNRVEGSVAFNGDEMFDRPRHRKVIKCLHERKL